MTTNLSPGINVKESNFSYYVKQISTATAAFIGIAERGPINEARLVTSWEQFTNTYGSFVRNAYLAYAARAFFDNGGHMLYINRVAHLADPTDRTSLTATSAAVTIPSNDATPVDMFAIQAANPGSWGNTLEVIITQASTDTFHLNVKESGRLVESHRDLSTDLNNQRNATAIITNTSRRITLANLDESRILPAPGTYVLSSGEDGLDGINDLDFIGDPSQRTGLYAFDHIDALNMIAIPGQSSSPIINAGITYAENRKDVFFIADPPPSLMPQEVIDFRQGLNTYTHAAFNSTYAGLYYPWLDILDPLTQITKSIPPSGIVAGCFARNDRDGHVWTAPAGIHRGKVLNVLGPSYKTSKGERDALYPEGINPIASYTDTGTNIMGQKTLAGQPSALDRVNVRRLMMYIEEAIAKSSRFVVFEPNHPSTWRALIRLIKPFLKNIQDNGGLYAPQGQDGYRVQCDEETNPPEVIDRHELVTRIFVKPTRAAEFIELNFALTNTGANFDEIFTPSR